MSGELVDYYSYACPASAPFFGYLGAASAMALANLGAAYGTAKAGAGISGMGVSRPDLVMKALIPVVMAGVVGIYGLIIAVIISTKGERAPCCCAVPRRALPSRRRQPPRAGRPRHSHGTCGTSGVCSPGSTGGTHTPDSERCSRGGQLRKGVVDASFRLDASFHHPGVADGGPSPHRWWAEWWGERR